MENKAPEMIFSAWQDEMLTRIFEALDRKILANN
jgi:hypothetical protein